MLKEIPVQNYGLDGNQSSDFIPIVKKNIRMIYIVILQLKV